MNTPNQLVLEVSDRDHAVGPADAPVTLVEYGDYECPHCGAAYPIVKALKERLGDSLRVVYRNFPLREAHPHAESAAEAAEAAGAQGQFWAMHDLLFENQRQLGGASLLRYAHVLELDRGRFATALESRVYLPRVQEDFLSGIRSGVNGTPTFFVNGVRHDGPFDLESLLYAVGRVAA